MHTRHGFKLADRIHTLLLRELGQGLDRQRMVHEARYARDVLLVCDALRGTDAPLLAQAFRRAAAGSDAAPPARSSFSASRFLLSCFGALTAR